jgi:hypothetical protein
MSILSRRTIMVSSSSSPTNRMPITPLVARPIDRSASSVAWKRIDCALRETSSRSSVGSTSAAPTSSSPSRRLMPMRPPVRGESKSVSLLFLTRPFRVARTRYGVTS